jgi:Thioredoxin domain-containing protein
MKTASHLFTVILSIVILLNFSCSKKQEGESTAKTKTETVKEKSTEEKAETPNTIGQPKAEIDYSKVQVVDEKRFEEEVCEFDGSRYGFKCKRPSIINFSAGWCRYCAEIAPYLVDFAQQYSDQIAIYKVDVDKCPNVAAIFKVQSLPVLIFVKPGQQPKRIDGAMSKQQLEQVIKDLLLS